MYSLTQIVTPSRTDVQGRLKLFSALQMMQDCSEMWKGSEMAYDAFLRENGAAQLLSFRQVNVVRVPRLGEELSCRTWVYGVQGAFGYRNTLIYDAAGKACYMCWCIGAFVCKESGRLLRIPQTVVEQMHFEPQMEMEYRPRKITLPDLSSEHRPPIAVQRNDIDYNQHVNNAHYIRMALELLPADFEPTGLRVEYKRPVTPGAVIEPAVIETDAAVYVQLCVAGQLCCLVEFTR